MVGSSNRARSVKQALAGFGRSVASDAVDLVGTRVARSSRASSSGYWTLAGHRFDLERSSSRFGQSALSPDKGDRTSGPFWIEPLPPTSSSIIYAEIPNASGHAEHGNPELRNNEAAGTQRASWSDLLSRSSFEYSLSGGNGDRIASKWILWGRGSVNQFHSKTDPRRSLDGKVWAGYLGLEYRFDDAGMLGGALSRSSGSLDYRGDGVGQGELEASLVSGYQYGSWTPRTGLSFWGVFGVGRGELEFRELERDYGSADLAFHMGALGLRRNIASLANVEWAAKADTFFSHPSSENLVDRFSNDRIVLLPSIKAKTWRLRLMIEGSRLFRPSEQLLLTPSFEVGMFREEGDFEENYSGEFGGALNVSHTGLGLDLAAKFRTQSSFKDRNFNDWSASLTLNIDPGHDGTGLSLALSPVWGDATSGLSALWQGEGGLPPTLQREANQQEISLHREQRFDLRLSYGMGLTQGLITPFCQFSATNKVVQRFRLGARLDLTLLGRKGLPGRLQMEFSYEEGTDPRIFLLLRHKLN